MTDTGRFASRVPDSQMSSADLLRECGRRLTDASLWKIFHERFHRQITLYVIRTILMFRGKTEPSLVCDLVQDVYYRLLKNKGSMMIGFRGETDFSALAFLGRTTMGIVSDYFRSQQADKRRPAEIISFEQARREEASRDTPADLDVTSILEWIDVQRLIDSEPDRRHATRNVLIFKLHYVEGLTVREISQYPGFDLTEGAIEVILKNLRNELRRRMGR